MERVNPKKILVIGSILVVFGFVGPLLMVLDILPSTYFLSFLSYGASVGGLILGVIGVSIFAGINKKRDDS
ncbi:hypothetical protein KA005_31505 [bacterium]|nr:hypothetical protein [bacterium]NOQ39045.1 hypothetical protein [Anaerolineales bacterium]